MRQRTLEKRSIQMKIRTSRCCCVFFECYGVAVGGVVGLFGCCGVAVVVFVMLVS